MYVYKAALIHSLIAEYQFEILALCETWTAADDPPAILLDFAPTGYRVHHVSRLSSTRGRRGGGLATIVRESTTVKPVSLSFQPTTFEYQALLLRIGRRSIILINTYRPPHSTPTHTFYNDRWPTVYQKYLLDIHMTQYSVVTLTVLVRIRVWSVCS